MRRIHALCVAAAALVATAIIGTGSASATLLCTAQPTGNPLKCPAGKNMRVKRSKAY